MNKSGSHHRLAVAGILVGTALLLLAGWAPPAKVSARSNSYRKHSNRIDAQRAARHAELQARLESTNIADFQSSLAVLVRMDEPGVLEVWRAALNNSDAALRREAWGKYREVQPEISRKQYVPQIAHIDASAGTATELANEGGYDITIWTSTDNQIVAAAPPYLLERLGIQGVTSKTLYNSIADWQKARAAGDLTALAITPNYQATDAASQIRIAVIDLDDRPAAAPGYSNWLGEREDILMRDGSRIAYLDIFQSDGSDASIGAHIAERYTRRGFKLEGFYSAEEFADRAPQLFAGKSFEAGRRSKPTRNGGVSLALANGKFHSYEQTLDEFKALATAHPDLAVYSKLGTSFEGRDIFALKISKDASLDDLSKPDVLITGLHHAREWISVESPVYFANRLLNGYATEDSIRYLVDHLQIWIVPIVNPDGLNYTQASPNEQMDSVRLWRKNRRPISTGNCTSGVGVDLNRNYSYQWRLQGDSECPNYCEDRSCLSDDMGGSDDPANEIYRGPKAESEPEVKAIKSLVDDPNRHFRAQLDYHNYSQLILYPWGYTSFTAEDNTTLSGLAQRMSDAVFAIDRKRYRPEQAVDLYTLTGSSIDYAYGVNKVPAPLLVEMRPDCCDFTVAEAQIPAVNLENWNGAQGLLNWAAGPPILEAVRAYTPGPDGSFSKLVYSARWVSSTDSNGRRQLTVETRFPGIDPGRLQVRLQFSKPMNTSVAPVATLGRDLKLDEVTLSVMRGDEGWQKTVYDYDTWVGETVLVDDGNLTGLWRLAVSASDPSGLTLDGSPVTIAVYRAGANHWDSYEDAIGNGNSGGIDTTHNVGPGVRGDYPSILVATPGGGERLAAGDDYIVAWTSPTTPGFTQSLSLSTDSGFSFAPLTDNIPADAQRFRVTMPGIATTRGRIRLLAIEPINHNFMAAVSTEDFSIGVNVGSNVDVSFVSSEKIDLNWVDMSTDEPPNTTSGASRLIINLTVKNRGSIPIASPFLRVSEMNRHVMLTRDPKSRWTEGARFYIDAGSDNTLSPGETANARLAIGLINGKKFFLSVNVYGVPDQPIVPASAADIWSGKPRTR